MKHCLALFLSLTSATLLAQADAQAHLAEALSAYGADRLDSAWGQVERALELDPALAAAYKLRGDIHQRRMEYDEALEDYRSAEKLDRTDPRLYVSRSALRISTGNYKGGLRDANKALDLDPEDPDAWYNRAWALYQGNDLKGALKSVQRAQRLAPSMAHALYLSGVIKGARYDEREGAEEIAQALALDPDIPGGTMSLAVLLYEDKRYELAIPKFTEVIDTDTTELAAAYYYRADCYYMLDDKEKACSDWNRSMRLGDKDATFIKVNYCDTDARKIPRKPKRMRRETTIQF